MKNFFHIFFRFYGKIGKKVCVDVIGLEKYWKNHGKIGKILKKVFSSNLPVFYQRTFAMQSEIFTILPILPQKIHRKKICLICIIMEEKYGIYKTRNWIG